MLQWRHIDTCVIVFVHCLKDDSQCSENCDDDDTDYQQYDIYKDIFDLDNHLNKFKVSSLVQKLLSAENIDNSELITFTIDELRDWCNEHFLKTIDKKRLIEAVKALPNTP